MPPQKVLIADDHAVFRRGLRDILYPSFEVIEARDGVEAIEKTMHDRPDVVVMDLAMPRVNGIDATREIKAQRPQTGVVVISASDDDNWIFEAIQAGASGYVVKDDDPEVMLAAVKSAAEGKAYLPPDIAKRVLSGVAGSIGGRAERGGRGSSPLSSREIAVLRAMATGKRNRDIARDLVISERTVGNHITSIYNKLGIYDRAQAVVYAIKSGIVRL